LKRFKRSLFKLGVSNSNVPEGRIPMKKILCGKKSFAGRKRGEFLPSK
jgi:hypothetical protein